MLRESRAAAAEYDTTYAGNLPAHDTTGRLDEWFEDNFTALPTHVRVHAPGVRESIAPTAEFGFLVLQDFPTLRSCSAMSTTPSSWTGAPSNLGGPRRRRYAWATAAAMVVTAAMVAAVATAVMRSAAAGRVRCRLLSQVQRCQQEVELPQKKCWAR